MIPINDMSELIKSYNKYTASLNELNILKERIIKSGINLYANPGLEKNLDKGIQYKEFIINVERCLRQLDDSWPKAPELFFKSIEI